ncbi:MAG TPA: D-lyxose/D-mannose family sugar isomerase [Ruminiclostridium sp.]
MLTKQQIQKARLWSREKMKSAGLVLRDDELDNIEIADFNLGDLDNMGLYMMVYVNTSRVCAKELIMSPKQTCPEHYHPEVDGTPGKEETFRCRWGKVLLYVPGEKTLNPKCKPPVGREKYYTSMHEIELNPGDQYTMMPGTPHWFQAGDEGAIISEFSTQSRDKYDVFTDTDITRLTILKN